MNWLEHEYLVPVVLGNSRDAVKIARKIYKATRIKTHIFAEKFSFWQKMTYNCHIVSPMREDFFVSSLMSFAASLEEYYCPVIVKCSDDDKKLVDKYSNTLESAYVAIELKDLFNK